MKYILDVVYTIPELAEKFELKTKPVIRCENDLVYILEECESCIPCGELIAVINKSELLRILVQKQGNNKL